MSFPKLNLISFQKYQVIQILIDIHSRSLFSFLSSDLYFYMLSLTYILLARQWRDPSPKEISIKNDSDLNASPPPVFPKRPHLSLAVTSHRASGCERTASAHA